MTYGQFNVLETNGKLSIIKQIPQRNMCWVIYIPDAGEDAYKICQLLNKEWEDRQPKTSSAEAAPPDEPSPGDIYARMRRGESISFEERQQALFYIPPDGTTEQSLLDKIGWDISTVTPQPEGFRERVGFNPFLSHKPTSHIEPQGPAAIKEALGFNDN